MSLSQKLFLIILLPIVLFDGIGLFPFKIFSFYLLIALPFILFAADIYQKKTIEVPQKMSLLFLGFGLFSLISVVFSVNRTISLRNFAVFISTFLIFIYLQKNLKFLWEKLLLEIVLLGEIFIFYSLLLLFYSQKLAFLYPSSGYQMVFSRFGSHNHLGDFLIIPFISLLGLYWKTTKKSYLFLAFLQLPFILISFSRSAYLSLILVFLTLVILKFKSFLKLNITLKILTLSLLVTLLVFFISTTKGVERVGLAGSLQCFLKQSVSLTDKPLFAKRPYYFNQALESFAKKPYFGIGPGNFIVASLQNANNPFIISESSHNLFLDILSENGLFAFSFFALIIGLFAFNGFKKLRSSSLIFLALLINFQTDYTFKIFSFWLIFLIFASAIYQEKNYQTTKLPFFVSIALLLITPLLYFGI